MRSILHKASGIFNQGKNSDEPHSGVQAWHTQDTLNNNPPSGAPPSVPRTTDESNEITKNILAFRTITALLEPIQQQRKFQVTPSKQPQPDCMELKISNTFSTIAVMENEVIAIVMKRTSEVLEITACTQAPAIEVPAITPPQPGLTSQIWHLLVTQNCRWDSKEMNLPVGKPIINDAGTLAALKLADDELKLWVDQYWSHLTMSRHLWILGRLLTMKRHSAEGPAKSSSDDSARLLHYVVTTCYLKMIHWLDHKTLSVPLIEALKQIRTFTFEESKLDQEQKEGAESDILFLTTFLPLAAPVLHISIPKIMEKTNMPLAIKGRSAFRLYTQDTCLEFHQLLVQLLLCFQSSLKVLVNYRHGLKDSTQSPQNIKDEVERVVIYGYALHRLTKGAALPMHLKMIAPLLRSLNLGSKITMPTPAPGEEQEEPDEDLNVVQPFVKVDGIEMPLWRSYLDWLRLMVAHFDAADILLTYVTGPSFVHHTDW